MDVIRKEGVFRLFDRQATLILTDEKQLERLATDPDKPLFDDQEKGFSGEKKRMYPEGTTLEAFVRDAKERGCERIEVSYDFFFGGSERRNYPSTPVTIAAFKQVHDCAKKYGMSFGASLISPLDVGGGYAKDHADTGFQWQFREGAIENGAYSVKMRRQIQWYNNKGPIRLSVHRVMAVAFNEEKLAGDGMYYVDENAVRDISDTAGWCVVPESYHLTEAGYAWDDIVISGLTDAPCNRVLVVIEYKTPEQDYFAADAMDYMKQLIDSHNAAGIRYGGFYSDEMHIQFDWDLNAHFGPDTEITTRYVTDSFIETFARLYGDKDRDFLKYMVYFAYGQHRFLPGGSKDEPSQHLMGRGTDGAYETWLFRKRYFELLSGRVVRLAVDSRLYAESLFGSPIMCRAHATWQESPTCDHFAQDAGFQMNGGDKVTRYDYDVPFVWSSTVRENISACGDYFRWNEFLSGAGTDHPEGGFLDRDYFAQAFACSLGTLNRFEKAYCAGWGSPKEVLRRFYDVGATYGNGDEASMLVQDWQHRLTDVLLLYPTELNYNQERFGTWMVQYGYGNYITEEMLLKYGALDAEGHLVVKGRKYRTVVALYEMFVASKTLDMLEGFASAGGRVVWSSVPALRYEDGADCSGRFKKLFGLKEVAAPNRPVKLKGEKITFLGELASVAPMKVLTDYLPDYAYPLRVDDAGVVARCNGVELGSYVCRGKGACVYLGFRPRDDQSRSTGADVSTLFDILKAVDAYAPGSPELLSRPADARYIFNVFPNGAVTLANHYRTFYEAWPGQFYRDEEEDRRALEGRVLPPVDIALSDCPLQGHRVSYTGTDSLTYLYRDGQLLGFSGRETQGVTIDGHAWRFVDEKADVTFACVDKRRLAAGIEKALLVRCDRPGRLTVPCPFEPTEGAACRLDFYRAELPVSFSWSNGEAKIDVTEEIAGKWIALVRT